MDLILTRREYRADGIFGEIEDADGGDFLFLTLEHSYDLMPKLPAGTYICERGIHRLSDLKPFETFEVMNVEGHSGILFHVGNYNDDSSGCILLGLGRGFTLKNGKMLTNSRVAFDKFMRLQGDVDSFKLIVKDSND